jgi:hypothetical protein
MEPTIGFVCVGAAVGSCGVHSRTTFQLDGEGSHRPFLAKEPATPIGGNRKAARLNMVYARGAYS